MKGFTQVQMIVGLVVAGLVAAAVVTVRSWVVGYGEARFTAGELKERWIWQARESAELQAANNRILGLEEKYRGLERKSATDVQAASAKLQTALQEVENAKDQARRDRDAGRAFGLRWQAGSTPTGEGIRGGPATAPGAGAGGRDGAASCELPRKTQDDLIELAGDADEVAKQLAAAQEIIVKDREVCR